MSDRCPTCGGRKSGWGPVRIIAAITDWNEEHGEPPRSMEWRRSNHLHPADTQVRRVFGSWNNAITAAGLTPRSAHRPNNVEWTKDGMRHAFFLWVYRHGRQPQGDDWVAFDAERPSRERVVREFGSWNAFVVACGYEPLKSHRSNGAYRASSRPRDELGRMVAS